MAAIVDEKTAALEMPDLAAAATRPDWRKQSHSWFLAGLVAANVAAVYLLLKLLGDDDSLPAIAYYGVLLGQLFLMGVWLALGGLHFALRLLAIAASTSAGAFACFAIAELQGDDLRVFALIGSLIVLLTFAELLPLRTLLGWRIDFDPAYHPRQSRRAMQLRLSQIIAYTAVCAAICALLRALGGVDEIAAAFFFQVFTMLTCLPAAWLIICGRRTWRAWCASAALLISVWIVSAVLHAQDLMPPTEFVWWIQCGALAIVGLNLGLLRGLFGLRLFSVLDPEPRRVTLHLQADTDEQLAWLVACWPRLPDAARSELIEQAHKLGAGVEL